MKKFLVFFISIIFCCIFTNSTFIAYADDNEVILGGFTAGFSVKTKGVGVIGLCDVITEDGIKTPSKDANLCVGDIILSINGVEVRDAEDISREIQDGKLKILSIKRCDYYLETIVVPIKDINGIYKIGVYLRDDICGIGTITFIKNGKYASLGHPILDEDGKLLSFVDGTLSECNITGCVKGERGKAGELRGVFLKTPSIGNVIKNTDSGVYGNMNKNYLENLPKEKISIGDAKIGNAKIVSTVSDTKKSYDVSIVKIDKYRETRNFVIKIEDDELLGLTGGIVQGMSGSPIIQDGRLVGAITHVFINDPTRGFGISVSNMLSKM